MAGDYPAPRSSVSKSSPQLPTTSDEEGIVRLQSRFRGQQGRRRSEQKREEVSRLQSGGMQTPAGGVAEYNLQADVMATYTAQLKTFKHTREELGEALKLFGLPIVAYPELSEVEKDLETLQARSHLLEPSRAFSADLALISARAARAAVPL